MRLTKLFRTTSPAAKQRLRQAGQKLGLEIRPTGLNSRDDLRLMHFLAERGIETILDVGANSGGFGQMAFAAGFSGRVISFEPLPIAHQKLTEAAKSKPGRWIVAPRLALSENEGNAQFHITQRDASSSLLKPTSNFIADTPFVGVTETIDVRTCRLDGLAKEFTLVPEKTLLKLDVQGGEAKVLAGTTQLLPTLAGVLTEMSLMPLYQDQPDFARLHAILTAEGFEIWDIWTGYRSANSHRLLQVDGLYFRSGLPMSSASKDHGLTAR